VGAKNVAKPQAAERGLARQSHISGVVDVTFDPSSSCERVNDHCGVSSDRSMGVSPMTVAEANGVIFAVHPPEPTAFTTILVLLTGHGRDAHATVGTDAAVLINTYSRIPSN
jgi:hypothetical protein